MLSWASALLRDRTAAFGAALVALVAVSALLATSLAPFDPIAQDRDRHYQAPGSWSATGSSRHLLGTDALGRDILSRTLHGARFSLATAVIGAALAVCFGGFLGILAGLMGGYVDRFAMRAAELMMALPALYLILAIRNLFPDVVGPSVAAGVVVVSLAAVGWTVIARLTRARVLSLREQSFVEASRAGGAGRLWILRRQLAPNLWPYLCLQFGLSVPYFLLGEVSMSYLGLGLTAPDPSWGNMLADGMGLSGGRWWTWLPPAALLTAVVTGLNLVLDRAGRSVSPALVEPAVQDSVPVGSSATGLAASDWLERFGSKHRRQRAS